MVHALSVGQRRKAVPYVPSTTGLSLADAVRAGRGGSRSQSLNLADNSAITHGDQINAGNTGIAGAGLTAGSLTTTGSTTYGSGFNGQTITGRRFTGQVAISASNFTLRNCQIEGTGAFLDLLVVTGTTVLIENVTILSSSSVYHGILASSGTDLTIRRCDVSQGENGAEFRAGTVLVDECYFHDASNTLNPTGHKDQIEINSGSVTVRKSRIKHQPDETSAINVAPWNGANHVVTLARVEDCFLDGGNFTCTIDASQGGTMGKVQILRNKFGGHNAVYGNGENYTHGVVNNIGRGFCETSAQQDASNPPLIWWPSSGADASTFAEGADLSPNRNDTVINPSTDYTP